MHTTNFIELLSQNLIFQGLTVQRLNELFLNIQYKRKSFAAEQLIISTGDICEFLIFILEGEVRGEASDFAGNTIKVENIAAPRALAPAFLFGYNNSFPVTVMSNTECQLLYIQRTELLSLFQQEQNILQNFLNIISNRSQFLLQKVKLLNLKSIQQRIAFFILKMNEQQAQKKWTQQELSELLGVTRPALARSLSEMEKSNILSYERGIIKILNTEKLKRVLHS